MEYKIETRCLHTDISSETDGVHPLSVPIYQTATFVHTKIGKYGAYDYTRESNPTRTHLEEKISSLEHASDTLAFANGMAAITACMELFVPGDRILSGEDLYGGTNRLFHTINEKNGIRFDYADTTDLNAIETAIRPDTRAIYVESPTNPMMRVTDIAGAAEIAHRHGLLLIVDNTFLSPYFLNPLDLGADIVIHSGTKFIGGHNDSLAGFLCVRDPELGERLRLIATTIGSAIAPFEAWLTIRGLKTLAVRMERQQENALKIAEWLKNAPHVTEVLYIGLPEHPGYEISKRQGRGFGSMISFRTDNEETARRCLMHTKLISFAESLGGVDSLITYPLTQTHTAVSEEERQHLGITDTLLRLSVGIEAAEDLIEDLRLALEGDE
ncbi:MAG: PLP-dependent transferase [Clostridia bacterium]|nr:PLP-dependent transferase [Clostridia bacterium]